MTFTQMKYSSRGGTPEGRQRELSWFEVLFPTAAPSATRIRALGAAVQLRTAIRVALVSVLGGVAAVSLGAAFDAVIGWTLDRYLSESIELEGLGPIDGVAQPLLLAIFAGWLAVRLWKYLDSAPLVDWAVLEAARSGAVKPDDIACDSGLSIAAVEASCWRVEAAGVIQDDCITSESGNGMPRFTKRRSTEKGCDELSVCRQD